jgi:endonuclease YncB( thermonuclease family)
MQKEIFKDYDIHTKPFSFNGQTTLCRLVDIIDGDSLVVILPVLNNYYKYHIRINGIDTCEIKSKNQDNKTLALQARCELLNIITKNNHNFDISKDKIKEILNSDIYILYLECGEFDKYGRLLANVYLDDSKQISLSEHLINKNLAYIYTGNTKLSESDQLKKLKKITNQ